MKLLAKSDIQKAKSIERQQLVNEGLKLAKRVDDLREVVAEEEQTLENFRRETLKEIHRQIRIEQAKLDKIINKQKLYG